MSDELAGDEDESWREEFAREYNPAIAIRERLKELGHGQEYGNEHLVGTLLEALYAVLDKHDGEGPMYHCHSCDAPLTMCTTLKELARILGVQRARTPEPPRRVRPMPFIPSGPRFLDGCRQVDGTWLHGRLADGEHSCPKSAR